MAIDLKQTETRLKASANHSKKYFEQPTTYADLIDQVVAAVAQAITLAEMFQGVLTLLATRLQWSVGHVIWAETEPGVKLIPSTLWYLSDPQRFTEFHADTMRTEISLSEGLPGAVALDKQARQFEDLAASPLFWRKESASRAGLQTGYEIPIFHGNHVIAVLEFFSERAEAPNEPLLAALNQLSTQLGQVVERLRQEEHLLQIEERLDEAQALAHVGSWIWDLNSDQVHWSEETYRIFGLPRGEFTGSYHAYLQLIHPDDRAELERIVREAYEHNGSFELTHRIIHSSGQTRYLHARGKVVTDESGKPVRMAGTGQDVTEHKLMELALQERQVMFESLFESASDGVVLIDQRGKILHLNRQAQTLFGYGRSELLGKSFETLVPGGLDEKRFQPRPGSENIFEQKPLSAEKDLRVKRKDGSTFPIDLTLSILQTKGDTQFICTLRDISNWRWAEEQLLTREKLLHMVVNGAPMIIWSADRQGKVTMAEGKSLALMGVSGEQLVGVALDELFQATPAVHEYVQRALAGEEVVAETKTPQGGVFETHYSPLFDTHREIIGVAGVAYDVTKRIQTENKLRMSEERYRQVIEGVENYAIFTLDAQGLVTSWNAGGEKILGYKAADVLGKHVSTFYTPLSIKKKGPDEALRHALEHGRHQLEDWRVRKDGKRIWANVSITPLYSASGEVRGFSKVVRDMTEHKRMEAELRASEERFRTVFLGAGIGISLVDLEHKLSICNPALQKMLGYSQEELQNRDLLEFTHPADVALAQKRYNELLDGECEYFTLEKRYMRKNGEVVWVSLTATLVRDASGEPRFEIKMIEDISLRKKLQAELNEVKQLSIRSNETERLRLAQEIHDEPLQCLYGMIFQLSDLKTLIQDAEGEKILADYSQILNRTINSLRAICGELRPPSLTPFGLDGAIRDHAERFHEQYPAIHMNLDLMFDYQILSETVRLSLFRIYQQAMSNVIRHAEASEVSVRFRWDHEQVILEIEDNGKGFVVPQHWIEAVRDGHMGLIGSTERIEMIHGRLEIISAPGKGTLIRAIAPRNLDPQTEGEDASLSIASDEEEA